MCVERISNTSYKLKKEKTDGTWYYHWVLKSEFEKQYKIIELLNVGFESLNSQLKISVCGEDMTKECPTCYGSGRIADLTITSGETTCPKCFGSGRIWK